MREAVRSAIAASEQEVQQLRAHLERAEESLRSATQRAQGFFRDLSPEDAGPLQEASKTISDLLSGAGASIEDFFARYQGSLATFNIVLFGRTGAGKSSLLSALAQLDGARVSRGESDWTVDVTPVPWNSCRLYDTPGVNGWGRTTNVEKLESAARTAVEVADVVLVCFDSQSQQASEFGKVAAWVEEFSKPAIAVLNVRNPMWRHPARIHAEVARANLQRSVREHASNIRDALTAIGMGGVPVVAVHTKHALDARATEPYVGPDDVNHHRRRAEFGEDYLYTWSNLGTVQELISALVAAGGAQLRVGVLRSGVRTVLESWSSTLDDEATQVSSRLDILDGTIAEELEVLGYPDESAGWPRSTSTGAPDAGTDTGADLLSRVEQARGGPYQARRRGRFERYLTQVVSNEFEPLRTASLKVAGKQVRDSFDKKLTLSSKEFATRVVDETAIVGAAARAADRAADFLARELSMTASEAATDLEFESSFIAVHGNSGRVGNRIGTTARGGSLLAGALGAGLSVAILTQAWNPVGWVGGAVLGGAALASMALNSFGKRRRQVGEEKRVEARKNALGSARVAVNSLYARIEGEVTAAFLADARATRAPVTESMLAQWLAVDGARRAVRGAADEIRTGAEELTSPVVLDRVMANALQAITDQREGAQSATGILLGEDWLANAAEHHETMAEESRDLAEMSARDTERLRAAVTTIGDKASPEQLAAWLAAVSDLTETSPEIGALLDEANRRQGRPPRIVFLGDYNTGKSSLIKRTLAEAGIATPPSLAVAARPTTSEAIVYEWAGLHLVDSPGLQSLHTSHQKTARTSWAGAALVVVVLNVNLVVGDHSELRALLTGSDRSRPKAGHALFVIGRSDELGVDPLSNPEQFLRLRTRKETELRQLLGRWDVGVTATHTVSADPYGIVGDDQVSGPDDFSTEFRTWDGIGALIAALEHADEHADALARVGALDFTVDGLLEIAADLRADLTLCSEERVAEEGALRALRRGIDSGVVLTNSLTADAQALARSHAERAAAEAMGATADRLADASEAAAHWWNDKEFQFDAVSFYDRAAKEIASWSADTESELFRNLRWEGHSDARRRRRGARRAANVKAGVDFGRGANNVGKIVTNILKERGALYTAAKKFTNIKFKPWGAAKAAAKVAKVGAVLAVVGVVLDAASFAADVHSASEREKARMRLADSIEQTLGRVERLLLTGSKRSPGPVTVLDSAIDRLRDQEAAAARRVDTLEELIVDRQRILGRVEELVRQQPLADGKDGSND